MKKSPLDLQIYNNTYTALKCLIDNCYYSQIRMREYNMKTGDYLKEFCTIRLTCSRQAGHSTAIAKIVTEYFNNAIILTFNHNMFKYTLDNIEKHMDEEILKRTRTQVSTQNSDYFVGLFNETNSLRGIKAEAVIVDCSFMMSTSHEENIYKTLGPSMDSYPQKFFIFVQ